MAGAAILAMAGTLFTFETVHVWSNLLPSRLRRELRFGCR